MLHKRLHNELESVLARQGDEYTVAPRDDVASEWNVTLVGPKGSCYAGGTFFLSVAFPATYPLDPPKVPHHLYI